MAGGIPTREQTESFMRTLIALCDRNAMMMSSMTPDERVAYVDKAVEVADVFCVVYPDPPGILGHSVLRFTGLEISEKDVAERRLLSTEAIWARDEAEAKDIARAFVPRPGSPGQIDAAAARRAARNARRAIRR